MVDILGKILVRELDAKEIKQVEGGWLNSTTPGFGGDTSQTGTECGCPHPDDCDVDTPPPPPPPPPPEPCY